MSVWDNPGEMMARAQAARAQGDRELAYQMYARASELNPQDVLAWQGRAETALSSDEALISYAYATALDGKNQALARTLDAAVAARVAGADKDDLGLLIALGQELAEVGLTERAQSLFQRATELDPASTDAWVWLAGTSSDSNAQVASLEHALATNPRDSRARAGLLAVKPPSAAPSPAPAPAPKPAPAAASPVDDEDLNAILAHATLATLPEEKEKLFSRALEIDPDNTQAKDGLSMMRVRRLRDSARTFEPGKEPQLRRLQAQPAAPDRRLRNILLLMILIVVVLAAAGIALQFLP